MKRSLSLPVGLVLVLLGAVWFSQGIGWLHGSAMTDETLWAVLGPVVAALGAVLVATGLSRGRADRE